MGLSMCTCMCISVCVCVCVCLIEKVSELRDEIDDVMKQSLLNN